MPNLHLPRSALECFFFLIMIPLPKSNLTQIVPQRFPHLVNPINLVYESEIEAIELEFQLESLK